MRLLHAGHGDGFDLAARREPQPHRSTRCASGSRATSAAAPATTTSSSPSSPQPARAGASDDPGGVRLRAGRLGRRGDRAACGEHGEDAKFLAGGHSLLPLMKLRLAQPSVLVDIGRLSDLSYINDDGDHIAIGALTRHSDVETSALLGRARAAARQRAVARRRSAGAPSRHDRRLDRPRRSGVRSARGDARARRDLCRRRGRAARARSRRRTSSRASSSRRSAPTRSSPRSGCRRWTAPAGLPEVQPPRPGLGDRRRRRLARRHRAGSALVNMGSVPILATAGQRRIARGRRSMTPPARRCRRRATSRSQRQRRVPHPPRQVLVRRALAASTR